MARFSGDIGRMQDPNLVVSPIQKPSIAPLFDLAQGLYSGKVEADLETEVETAVGEFISSNRAAEEAAQQLEQRRQTGSEQMRMLIDQTISEDPELSFEAEDDYAARSQTAKAFEQEITGLQAAAQQGGMSIRELELRVDRATRGAIDRLPGLAPRFRQLAANSFGNFEAELAPYMAAQQAQQSRADAIAKDDARIAVEARKYGMSEDAYRAFEATVAQNQVAKELAKTDANRFSNAMINSYENNYQIALNQGITQFADESGLIDPTNLSKLRQSVSAVYQQQRAEITQTAAERGWDRPELEAMLDRADKQHTEYTNMLASADKAKVLADTLNLQKNAGQLAIRAITPELALIVDTFGTQGAGSLFKEMSNLASLFNVIRDPSASATAKTYAQNKVDALYEAFPNLRTMYEMGMFNNSEQQSKVAAYYFGILNESYKTGAVPQNFPGFMTHNLVTSKDSFGSPEVEKKTTRLHINYTQVDKKALSTFEDPNAAKRVIADPVALNALKNRVEGELTSVARATRDYVNADLSLGFMGRQNISPEETQQIRALRLNESIKNFDQIKRLLTVYGPYWYGEVDPERSINNILAKEGLVVDTTITPSRAQQDLDDIRRIQQRARQPMAGITVQEPVVQEEPADTTEPVGIINPATGRGTPISSQESIDALPPGLRSQMTPIERMPEATLPIIEDANAEYPEEDMDAFSTGGSRRGGANTAGGRMPSRGGPRKGEKTVARLTVPTGMDRLISSQESEKIPKSTIDLLHEREGFRQYVYPDSVKTKEHPQGQPTVGYGHLILPNKMYTLEDGTTKKGSKLKFGDVLDLQELNDLFLKNLNKAYAAANKQAAEAGINDPEFLDVLTSVNFQLGTNWTKTFFNSWPAIKSGNYDKAIDGIKKSRWARQTPKRVDDFVRVLEKLKANKTSAVTPP